MPPTPPSSDTLSRMAQANRMDEVQRLLDAGASADSHGLQELPALTWAAQNANVAMLDLLLERGADPGWTWLGNTLGHFAALGGDLTVTQRLLDLGVPFGRSNAHGLAPVHHAVHKGHLGWLRWAQAQGLDLSPGDDQGQTPLHWAVIHQVLPSARVLIELGADLDREDHQGRTAAAVALAADRTVFVELLVGSRIARERQTLLNAFPGAPSLPSGSCGRRCRL